MTMTIFEAYTVKESFLLIWAFSIPILAIAGYFFSGVMGEKKEVDHVAVWLCSAAWPFIGILAAAAGIIWCVTRGFYGIQLLGYKCRPSKIKPTEKKKPAKPTKERGYLPPRKY